MNSQTRVGVLGQCGLASDGLREIDPPLAPYSTEIVDARCLPRPTTTPFERRI
jgi:hypothetical protein